MIRSILILLLFGSSYILSAQGSFPSENGLFTVNYLKGCSGTQIEVTPENGTGTPFLCFDADLSDIGVNNACFGQPAQSADDFRFTYTEPGVYDILFLRQLTNSQVYDSISIEILNPATPFVALSSCDQGLVLDVNSEQESFDIYTVDFGDGSAVQEYSIDDFPFSYQYANPTQESTLTVNGSFDTSGNNNCSNNQFSKTFIPANQTEEPASITRLDMLSSNSFEIDYELNVNQTYQLQLKQNEDGDFQSITTFVATESGSYTFQNIDLDADFYCARLISTSRCNGQQLISNEVCTIRLSATVELGGNLLDWNHANFQNSDVLKNGELIFSGNAPYLDENVFCGQVDEYQIIATDASGVEVVSLARNLAANTAGPTVPIGQIATRVLSDTEVEITWDLPAGLQPDRFLIYKKRNEDEDFFRLDTTSTTSYIDESPALNERVYYYSVAYLNLCGGISPVQTVAPNILLTLSQQESVISFKWNSFTGFGPLLRGYVLKKYDDNMNLLSENNVDTTAFYSENIAESDNQLTFYQLEAISENGLVASSNLIRYKIPSSFFVPTGFTPNEDGQNEEIKVLGKFIQDVEFSVYNRWGTLIFRSTSLDAGWDGYLTTRPAPEGTYSYTVRVKDKYGEEYYKSGVFNLIR
ncbi:gliding motility-associated C-terminal domain-containing protein [Marivirga sericea]|uniref:Gliding motility-associated C-terminal domain-containing protein n=1 Tax=Marivirga sericea TaxID=1028 RepID=A0A1X7JN02_9BACT|nr:gliding motility-associated C-terminal domain-containing protein [Marivirga sericea]SMG29471.1 gliding motility-associated C-terminal domain-containing protein [Marivirga sericea]